MIMTHIYMNPTSLCLTQSKYIIMHHARLKTDIIVANRKPFVDFLIEIQVEMPVKLTTPYRSNLTRATDFD